MKPIHYIMLALSAVQALLIAELAFFPQYTHAFGAIGVAVTVVLGVLAQISGPAAAAPSPAKALAASMPSDSATVIIKPAEPT